MPQFQKPQKIFLTEYAVIEEVGWNFEVYSCLDAWILDRIGKFEEGINSLTEIMRYLAADGKDMSPEYSNLEVVDG